MNTMPNHIHSSINKGVKLSTTSSTALYTTPPQKQTHIQSIIIANTDTVARDILLEWTDNSESDTYQIIPNVTVPPQDFIAYDLDLFLEGNDILKATAVTANTIEITLHYDETPFGFVV